MMRVRRPCVPPAASLGQAPSSAPPPPVADATPSVGSSVGSVLLGAAGLVGFFFALGFGFRYGARTADRLVDWAGLRRAARAIDQQGAGA